MSRLLSVHELFILSRSGGRVVISLITSDPMGSVEEEMVFGEGVRD